MANAKRDGNARPTILGTLDSDGTTPTLVKVDPVTFAMKTLDNTTGTASTRTIAPRDENSVPVWMGVSSADMVTLIPIATDSSGNLLVQST